jgi:hypothetical protein
VPATVWALLLVREGKPAHIDDLPEWCSSGADEISAGLVRSSSTFVTSLHPYDVTTTRQRPRPESGEHATVPHQGQVSVNRRRGGAGADDDRRLVIHGRTRLCARPTFLRPSRIHPRLPLRPIHASNGNDLH